MQRPAVHPEIVRYLESKIPQLELSEGESPQSLMEKALIRKGKLEFLAILKSMSKDN